MLLRALLLATAAVQAVVLRPEQFGLCKPDGVTLCTAAIRRAIAACEANRGCALLFEGPGIYLTQSINLTSNMELRIGANATVLGTSEDRYNSEAAGWPVLPWPEYPSLPTRTPSRAWQVRTWQHACRSRRLTACC